MLRVILLAIAIFLGWTWHAVAADEWGDLALRLVYDGEAPLPKPIVPTTDWAVCRPGALMDESVLVDKENRGVANVLMWLVQREGDAALPIHSDYDMTAKAEVTLAVKNCRYEPHVTLVRNSQTLVLKVLDPVAYRFRASLPQGDLDVLLPAAGVHKVAFTASDSTPTRIECSIHGWVRGELFVHNNPYMAASDASGKLTLKKLPVGRWTFRFWHERCGFIRKATLGGKPVEWRSGRVQLEIKPGVNDLGDILIKPATFKE